MITIYYTTSRSKQEKQTVRHSARHRTASNINLHTESAAGQSMATRFGTSGMTKRVELRFLFAQDMVVKS